MLSYSANPLAFIMKNKNIIQIIFFNTDLWSCFSLDLLIIQHSNIRVKCTWLFNSIQNATFLVEEHSFNFCQLHTMNICFQKWPLNYLFWVLQHIYSILTWSLFIAVFGTKNVHSSLYVDCVLYFFLFCCKWMLSANCLCVQKMHFEDAIIPPPLTGVMPRYYGLNLLWPYNEAEAEAASQCAQRSKNFCKNPAKNGFFVNPAFFRSQIQICSYVVRCIFFIFCPLCAGRTLGTQWCT